MDDPQTLVGLQIDHFQVLRHIGQGGMANVYLAYDVTLQRQVVLKTMLPELAQDQNLMARFQREAQATAQLSHPNIVQVYTTGVTPTNEPYIALQYIEGGSLSEHLQQLERQGQWVSAVYALTLVRQLAAALVIAHQANIIHRDIKPGNILLRADGSPVLSDLGIAAIRQAATRLTRTGGILGTPHYMSPEQGSGRPVDGRSDLYSLGVILYELLSGQLPFRGDSPLAIIHQHLYEQPVPLEEVCPGLTAATYDLVRISLQKDPAARYQTPAAMMAAADHALRTEDVGKPAVPAMAPRQAAEPQRADHRPLSFKPIWAVYGLIPIAVLTLLFVSLGSSLFDQPSATATRTVTTATRAATEAATTIAEVVTATVAATAITSPTPTSTTMPVPSATPMPTPEPALGIQSLSGNGVTQMTDDAGSSQYSAALSPDQATLIFMSDQSGTWQIYAMDTLGGQWRRLTDNSADNYHPHFSPDGEQIVFASKVSGDWEIYTMNVDGRNLQRLTERPGDDVYPSFSPDGAWILYMSRRDQGWGVYAMRADGRDDRVVVDTETDETFPSFSPDDQTIVYQSYQSGNNHDIYTISWDGEDIRQITTDPARDANPVFSPDGQWIAFETDRDGNYEVHAVRPDGSDLHNLTNHPGRDQLPSFSPDGRWLLFQSDRGGSVDIYRQPSESLLTAALTTPTGEPAVLFQMVPLGEKANASIDFTSPPVGEVTLSGVPFRLSERVFKSQASPSPYDNAPASLQLPVDVPRAYQLHLLLNSGNGFAQFNGAVIGRVMAECGGNTAIVAELQLGRDVREWHMGPNVVSTASRSSPVWSQAIDSENTGYIDLLTLDLPAACQSGRLTAVELVDTSSTSVGSLDPALNLIGITISYR